MPPEPESLADAAAAVSEQIKPNHEIVSDWIADGTPAAEPVTTETPAGQPRDPETGKFLPKEPVDAGAGATSIAPQGSAPVPPAPGASAAEVQEFIDAQLADGSPFKLPKGVRIPLKRGETTIYDPIEDVQKRGMLELDYRHKTADTARERRSLEQERIAHAAAVARTTARETWLNERETEMREAQKDPEKWAAYQEMQRLYQENPQFRKVMDDALAKRETDAVNAVYQERDYQAQVQEGVTAAAGWIDQLASDPAFQGVNPDRVRVRYAEALQSGRATLDPREVRALYEDEARYVVQTTSPLTKELADLKAEVAALKAGKAAEKHNAGTAHALNRAKTPPVAATGRPPAPTPAKPTGKFGLQDLVERNQAWANQRD